MNRRTMWLAASTVLALVLIGFLLPSLLAGEFTVNVSGATTVVLAAIIAGTVLGLGTPKR